MKFIIYYTTDYNYPNGKPKLNEKLFLLSFEKYDYYDEDVFVWYIELNSMEDFAKLYDEVGTFILSFDKEDLTWKADKAYEEKDKALYRYPSIEIYNGYRE